jgi:DHA2 family multidrug resistance protein-like MFS transporter
MKENVPIKAGRKEWLGLIVIALPCILYSMDLTVLNLAVPKLSAELKPTSSQLLWIVDIYGFLLAGMLITMGTLGDQIGRRRLLLIGAAAFGLASILAAFSTSAEMLILSRAILGVAGATLAPSTLSLIRNMFLDPKQRTVAISVWITSYSVGGAIGPVIGGLLLEHYSWSLVFLISVPVMILLLIAGPLLLPEFKDPDAGGIDFFSAVLSLGSVLATIYGVKHFVQSGFNVYSLVSILAGLVLGLFFIRRQKKLSHPLVDLTLFKIPSFSTSLVVYTLGTFVLFGIFFFIAQYLQLVLELSPLEAGLWTLPSFLGFIVGSIVTPNLTTRFKPAIIMATGFATCSVGLGLLAVINQDFALPVLVASVTLLSLGMSPVFTLATDSIVGSAPAERAGIASSISETGSELGGALGIAILGSVGTLIYKGKVSQGLTESLSSLDAATSKDTLSGATTVASTLAPPYNDELLNLARAAFTDSIQLVALICGVLALIAAVVMAFYLSKLSGKAS